MLQTASETSTGLRATVQAGTPTVEADPCGAPVPSPLRRLAARVVDWTLLSALTAVPVSLSALIVVSEGLQAVPFLVFVSFLAAVFALCYEVLSVSRSGRTVGKAMFGIRVVNHADLETLSVPRSLGRTTILVIAGPLSIVACGLSVVLRNGDEFRGLHDVTAGSKVTTDGQ